MNRNSLLFFVYYRKGLATQIELGIKNYLALVAFDFFRITITVSEFPKNPSKPKCSRGSHYSRPNP